MSNIIHANDLKTRGVSAIAKATANGEEAVITVRNKMTYVVLPIEQYNHLRECELEAAVQEVRDDMEKGRFVVQSAEDHVKGLGRG
ncbi:MAG: prevent-host-death protein [Candidatus Raymondbacteria bacterium RifOxyA12_full_50_37]|uniref:Prevent-host-death protein n=1 Tax=Candidatus Raymondbacteria bacterium RIFOXYD12_FULL_49_13 TaxID=1817890 RepID=A0A1F7EZV8_UNCRA|nr:MAG: prevent-host-death protein [Candidatus Raymondbacteria bacterium RifOxyA12_full_50_37]OGJ93015.1 MAG: prevent-host-death protein [Candidatus Raymondbacteria bacterium RIFOXYA2_FULL_49_16]OGJ93593.1 MAG: prevent-host-death protein [Candidatus Raymondbacteria bacterium RifOxyB12_full_50_8]OGJ99928.1 MAG: prevent-host-death protein [Candidatus Raymondbacteria bacterium RIFOXYD12_FULL_49_13]OGK01562.1 MAG: prevent-host-death protein [Candidatus Raymondbacteria bacterium RifOxyC12_full_50_8]